MIFLAILTFLWAIFMVYNFIRNRRLRKQKALNLKQEEVRKRQEEQERIKREESFKMISLQEEARKRQEEVRKRQEEQERIKREESFKMISLQEEVRKRQEEVRKRQEEQERIKREEVLKRIRLAISTPIQAESTFNVNKFEIYRNSFLQRNILAFYHADYHGGGNWKREGTIENMIWTLKNDVSPFPSRLPYARQKLRDILLLDLPQILSSTRLSDLIVCVVPRAKNDSYYRRDQLYFRQTISGVVNSLSGFRNGVEYVKRVVNTKTTHLKQDGGDGRSPYIGITKGTCRISREVQNGDILLIDDIYTKGVNIDEDAIQALLDNGARSVIFYAIGKTVSRY